MLYLLNFANESYSQVLAIVNFICFGSVCFCAVCIYIAAAIGQFVGKYKHMALSATFILTVLFIIHFLLLKKFGIPLLVPPVGTPYFTEFMHVMQFLASISIVFISAYIFVVAALSRFEKSFHNGLVGGVIYLIILFLIHFYIEDNFGILLIFPPSLW